MSANQITIQDAGILGGGGAITATDPVVLDAGALLQPGSAVNVGTLNITGDLTLADGSQFNFDLDTVEDSDKVELTGTLTLNDQEFADFTFDTLGGFGAGEYILFEAAGISGTGLGSSLTGDIDGLSSTLSIDGTDVILTVVPEPNTAALLVSGLLTLLLFARRRRKG